MNNNQNDLVRWAMEKIRNDERHRPNCCVVVGPTGPSEATDRFNNSSNKIIAKYF